MKLLFDQNVSPKLVAKQADIFPGSAHVFDLSMDRASDDDLWQFAKRNSFTVVSKDEDFNLMSVSRGFPPKVICLLLVRPARWKMRFERSIKRYKHSRRTLILAHL